MNPPQPPNTFNGTMEEVRRFFKVKDIDTVAAWCSDKQPKTGEPKEVELASWKNGRNVIVPETAVVELYVRRYRAARPLAPGELEAQARREWREHLNLPYLLDLEERVAALERSNMKTLERMDALERNFTVGFPTISSAA